jgi:hypothetical protein
VESGDGDLGVAETFVLEQALVDEDLAVVSDCTDVYECATNKLTMPAVLRVLMAAKTQNLRLRPGGAVF